MVFTYGDKKMGISAVILTQNEEASIGECLDALSFCDEILVIDSGSTDATTDIAEKKGAQVYRRTLNGDFAAQRNFGLSKATQRWVLFVDADERVSKALSDEIIQITSNPMLYYKGFFVKRVDTLWGRELRHGEMGNVRLLRLARKGAGKWRRSVHEVWEINGRTYSLKSPLKHHPHPSMREFISHINFFSTLHAKANFEEGKRATFLKVILYPIWKFLLNWIMRRGFLDGTQGFLAAILMSLHSFLAWGKLWLYQKKNSY